MGHGLDGHGRAKARSASSRIEGRPSTSWNAKPRRKPGFLLLNFAATFTCSIVLDMFFSSVAALGHLGLYLQSYVIRRGGCSMRLKSAQVRMFRNILDSTPVAIDPKVTCLVGKNESGKSAFLTALWWL
ncbi:MAG: AAA family ATPase, partial [Pseudolabrys sp.]